MLSLDFPEDNQSDGLLSSMQMRFPNFQVVPFFQSRKAPSDPSSEQVKIIARETILIPYGPEAVIFGELPTRGLQEKSDGFSETSPALSKKHQVLAFNSFCESEEMIPACLDNPVEDVTVYNGTSRASFSVVGSAEIAAM